VNRNVFYLVRRELLHRKANFLFGTLAVCVAAFVLCASTHLLQAHDKQTQTQLVAKQTDLEARINGLRTDTVRAMENLGFNITILPIEQNLTDWYAEDYAERTMPAAYLEKLEASGLVTIENLIPVLRRKVRWPETRWTVIVAGVGGRNAPLAGEADIGAEISRGLNLRAGDAIKIFDRSFTVRRVMAEEGAADDITLTFSLTEGQVLLNAEGRINEIRALECQAAWQDLPRIRTEVAHILPDTQVIEKGSETLARATSIRQVEEKGLAEIEHERATRDELRTALTRLISVLLPILLLVCLVWVYLVSAENVEKRTPEVGLFRSLGFSSPTLVILFLFRAALMGLLGGALGLMAARLLLNTPFRLPLAFLTLAGALVIALLGGMNPIFRSVRRDPADILRGDV